jgi:hypothetical protein
MAPDVNRASCLAGYPVSNLKLGVTENAGFRAGFRTRARKATAVRWIERADPRKVGVPAALCWDGGFHSVTDGVKLRTKVRYSSEEPTENHQASKAF